MCLTIFQFIDGGPPVELISKFMKKHLSDELPVVGNRCCLISSFTKKQVSDEYPVCRRSLSMLTKKQADKKISHELPIHRWWPPVELISSFTKEADV